MLPSQVCSTETVDVTHAGGGEATVEDMAHIAKEMRLAILSADSRGNRLEACLALSRLGEGVSHSMPPWPAGC